MYCIMKLNSHDIIKNNDRKYSMKIDVDIEMGKKSV